MTDFKVSLRRRNIPKEELLADLRRCAAELSKDTVTVLEYTGHGKFGVNTFLRGFKQWNLALSEAGLKAPHRQHIPDTELFENLANLWVSLGRQPYGRDVEKARNASAFSLGTYEKRFGTWNEALLAFEAFIKSGQLSARSRSIEEKAPSKKRMGSKVNWRLRAQVLIRDNCICQMCGASPAKDPTTNLHADHITPWSKGGETTLENLRTLCAGCNIGKSNMDW
jgi:hypothetical protein